MPYRSKRATPGVTVGVLPEGYRKGQISVFQYCGNCRYGLPQRSPLDRGHQVCRLWWAPVRSGMTCDKWEGRG